MSILCPWGRRPMTVPSETAACVRELAEASGESTDEVLAGAVKLLAVHRVLLWTGRDERRPWNVDDRGIT